MLSPQPQLPPHAPRVLIVDDEAAILEVTHRMARSIGWRALLADSSAQAMATFREHADEISCVLLDLHMPGVDGVELSRSLRSIRPGLRIVLMTGDDPSCVPNAAHPDAPDHVLTKPFLLHDLEEALVRRAQAA